jgi:hypothetical protein
VKYLLSKVVSSSIQYLTLYFCLSLPLFKNPQSPTHPDDDPILNVQQQIVVFHISAKPLSMPSSCDCKKRTALDADSKESTDGMPLALEYFSLFLFPIPNLRTSGFALLIYFCRCAVYVQCTRRTGFSMHWSVGHL